MSRIGLIVSRSLRQHALSTAVTVLSVALASGLLMAVFAIKTQAHDAFTGGAPGFDAVLGARGSQLQLVLNTVFHLESSPGNISWKLYQRMKAHPLVKLAIPYAVGDNYRGCRLVGTTPEIFSKFEYQDGRKFTFRDGSAFKPERMEAVIGSFVAQKTGLKTGDLFHPSHGLGHDSAEEHEEEYAVAGVLEPTNTPSDRVIWIPIDGIFRMGGHVLRGGGEHAEYTPHAGEEIPDDEKEVSAVMLKFTQQQAGFVLDQQINNKERGATLAWPIGRVMADLFEKIGWMDRVLELVAYLVVAVATGSILASIYNTMNERRREFAILRALGARRRTLFAVIVSEAAAIALLGGLCGFAVYGLILAGAAQVIRAQTGVVLDIFQFHPVLVCAPAGMVLAGALAGIVPALKAYRTDVASNLSPLS